MKRIPPQTLFASFILMLGAPILVKLWGFSMDNHYDSDSWLYLTFLGVIGYLTVYHLRFKVTMYALEKHDAIARQRYLLLKIKQFLHALPATHMLHGLLHDLMLLGRLLLTFIIIDIALFFLEWNLFIFMLGLIVILLQMTIILADSLRYYTMKEMGIPETHDGHFLM